MQKISTVLVCALALCGQFAVALAGIRTMNEFSLTSDNVRLTPINRSFSNGDEIAAFSVDLDQSTAVYGAGVTMNVTLFNDGGLVRVVLIDKYGLEYLAYETFALLENDYTFSVNGWAQETRLLENVTPKSLRIELLNASIELENIAFATSTSYSRDGIAAAQEQIREQQLDQIVDRLNTQIKKKGMAWVAGKTDMARKTYMEKKDYLRNKSPIIVNLEGMEYYVSGVFEIRAAKPDPASAHPNTPSRFIANYDWRARHGATKSGSPYYNDATNGWCTSVKDQGQCGSCWCFSTVGCAEVMANLHFNQHLKKDYSEQYIMECGEGGYQKGAGCQGGDCGPTTKWVASHGLIDEASFPYRASDSPTCGDTSKSPKDLIQFAGYVEIPDPTPTDDSLKSALIKHGPLNVAIKSKDHAMVLVAYKSSGSSTTWILRNSWGPSNQAYMQVQTSLADFIELFTYKLPAIIKTVSPESVRCVDLDKDGFYNWGLGPKPANIPSDAKPQEDCDDSNKDLGPMAADGSCEQIKTGIVINTLPNSQILYNCSPNPMNRTTSIKVVVPQNSIATIQIFNLSGSLIKTLTSNNRNESLNNFIWDGTTDDGSSVGNGTYICKINLVSGTAKTSSTLRLVVSR
ncbi:MAG: T9SS type A sorting domain-containing protein [Chitinivibrionales bacterium]|nr:T9SS type A sorting domain-containing protein [Chitinivibrionales bacterium]